MITQRAIEGADTQGRTSSILFAFASRLRVHTSCKQSHGAKGGGPRILCRGSATKSRIVGISNHTVGCAERIGLFGLTAKQYSCTKGLDPPEATRTHLTGYRRGYGDQPFESGSLPVRIPWNAKRACTQESSFLGRRGM